MVPLPDAAARRSGSPPDGPPVSALGPPRPRRTASARRWRLRTRATAVSRSRGRAVIFDGFCALCGSPLATTPRPQNSPPSMSGSIERAHERPRAVLLRLRDRDLQVVGEPREPSSARSRRRSRRVRPLVEYPGCATTLATGTAAARSRRSASKPSARRRDLRLHVRAPPACSPSTSCGSTGSYCAHRRSTCCPATPCDRMPPRASSAARRRARSGRGRSSRRRPRDRRPWSRAPSADARSRRSAAARPGAPRPRASRRPRAPTRGCSCRAAASRRGRRPRHPESGDRTAARAAASRFGLRPVMTTRAPAAASCSLEKNPSPAFDPVTR